jgi:hypothetical protein
MYLLKRITCVFVVFVVLLTGVRTLGNNHPDRASPILDPVSCSLPCWHNIYPGATKFQDVQAILQTDKTVSDIRQEQTTGPSDSLNYQQICWSFVSHADWQGCAVKYPNTGDDYVTWITFTLPSNIYTLGDAITTFGEPVFGIPCVPLRDSQTNFIGSSGYVGFDNRVSASMSHGSTFPNLLNAYMGISEISFLGPYGSAAYPSPWTGFKPDPFGCF